MIFVAGYRNKLKVISGQYASVWGFSNSGVLNWTYDTGADTLSIDVNTEDGADYVYVCGYAGTNGYNVWKLNASTGAFIKGYKATSPVLVVRIDDTNDKIYVGDSTLGGASLKQLDTNLNLTASFTPVGYQSAPGGGYTVLTGGKVYDIIVDDSGNVYCVTANPAVGLIKLNGSLIKQAQAVITNGLGRSLALFSTTEAIVVGKTESKGISSHNLTTLVQEDNNVLFTGIVSKIAPDTEDNIYAIYSGLSGDGVRVIKYDSSLTELESLSTTKNLYGIMRATDGLGSYEFIVCGERYNNYTVWKYTADGLINKFDTGSTARGIAGSLLEPSINPPKKAINPNPPNGGTGESVTKASAGNGLQWDDGGTGDSIATSYKVYFGVDEAPVSIGEVDYTDGVGEELTLGFTLDYKRTYYWRVDTVNANGEVTGDLWSFKTADSSPAAALDKKYKKKLCAIANNAFHYENDDPVPDMVTLEGLTLDTTKKLAMFDGYQKVFIVNGIIRKIVDFANTKITIDGKFTVPPMRGDKITGDESDAELIVDYVENTETDDVVYGYNTIGNFQIGEVFTSDNAGAAGDEAKYMNPATPEIIDIEDKTYGCLTLDALASVPDVDAVLIQANTGATLTVKDSSITSKRIWGIINGIFNTTDTITKSEGTGTLDPEPATLTAIYYQDMPHHYNWLPYYNNTNDYGELPETANIGCLYRGRPCLAGNIQFPHVWYMGRQGDPFDWKYVALDAQSPIAATDSTAGRIGDVITAMIPYKDDYLIVGCANTVWIVRGDPAAGGSIDNLSWFCGVLDQNAWCYDNKGNLYFLSSDGLYSLPVAGTAGLLPSKNVTKNIMPNFTTDMNIDIRQDVVHLAYDKVRNAISVNVTKIDTGQCNSYWFDLAVANKEQAGGLYRDTYPVYCSPFTSFYYDSDNPKQRRLLFGSKDGHIRTFDEELKYDMGESDEAINSYVIIGPIALGIPEGSSRLKGIGEYEGKLVSLTITTSGGKPGGVYSDTDQVSYGLYTAKGAEEVIENIIDGARPLIRGKLTMTGKSNTLRQKISGAYLGIKLSNTDKNTTWSIEQIVGEIKITGRA